MIYALYLVLVPLSLFLTLIAVILAPVLPVLATAQEGWLDNHAKWGYGPRLPTWLSWFQTPDNSLDGDATFERLNGISYWSKVKWLWRNPCYAFALRYLSNPFYTQVSGDKTIKDNDNAKAGWCLVHAMDYFNLLLLPLLAIAVVFILIWGGMCVVWSMITSNQSLIRIKPHSSFRQE